MRILIYIITCILSSAACAVEKPALIIVPVADLVGSPIQEFGIAPTIQQAYDALAYGGSGAQPGLACPRVQQLLFNDLVSLVKDEGEQVCIRIPQAFFITSTLKKPQTIYWTLKKNIMTLDKIKHHERIPAAVQFTHPTKPLHQNNIAILKKPWLDAKSHKTYSVGTRFVYEENPDNTDTVRLWVFNPHTRHFQERIIAKEYCIVHHPTSFKEQRTLFLSLLREWAHPDNNIIGYVWGGKSYTHTVAQPFCEKTITNIKNKQLRIFDRDDSSTPRTGFDCAGIILHAAHMSGLPFFYKNSYTMATLLAPLSRNESIEEGDIMWIQGHVMVVSNTATNTLIEARGYTHGYGIVHEAPLSKIFAGITTYKDLEHAYYNAIPLQRLDNRGTNADIFGTFKILKLNSIATKDAPAL